MTEARRAHAWTIRALFVLALVVLFLPSRLMALAHGADAARFAAQHFDAARVVTMTARDMARPYLRLVWRATNSSPSS